MPKRAPKTITLFDGPTEGNSNGRGLEAVPYITGPAQGLQARSLLIESLVEQLCTFVEPDPQRQKTLFCYICQKLKDLKFLVPGLPQDDALPVRRKFRELTKNFIKLSIRNCDLQNNNALVPRDVKSSTLLSPDLCDDFSGLLSSDIIFQSSRYTADFSEEEVIASGGFGIVCKAWKKVDQQYYAVKKIPFKYMQDPLLNKVLREVEFLAQNSHPNVVAYKTAWIEPSTDNDPVLEFKSDSSSDRDTSDNLPSGPKYARTEEDSSSTLDESSDYIVFTETTETSYRRETVRDSCKISVYCEDTVQSTESYQNFKSEHTANTDVSVNEFSSQTEVQGAKKPGSDPSKEGLFRPKPVYRRSSSSNDMSLVARTLGTRSCKEKGILYVQMELCKESLRQWLDKRLDSKTGVDITQSTAILKQVIKGVEYLHSKGIIHRDLKPQNILFSDSCVKIGDFGLATLCCQNGTENERNSNIYGWIGHTQGVGTSPYAAPEQRKGNQYGFKADMYSIGVIWLELLYSFRTSMELSKCLEDVHGHKCNLPKQLLRDQPEAAKMIDLLTQSNPECRPSASDVLNSELFLSKAQIIEKLKQQLTHKDGIIEAQKKELHAKDMEISLLQSRLMKINVL